MKVFRIPLKRVYKKIQNDFTWDQVFGNKRCCLCKQLFKEKDAYVFFGYGKRRKSEYAHVECMEKHESTLTKKTKTVKRK